jgi:hypothetical protein
MFALALAGTAIAGAPPRWSDLSISYWVAADVAPLDDAVVMDEIEKGFRPWDEVEEDACADIDFRLQGRDEDSAYSADGRNTVFVVAKDWPYEPELPLAVELVVKDGVIEEGDIALNAENYTFQVTGDGDAKFDIRSTVAHAVGLLLGLERSEVNGATMNALMVGRTEGRDLDDSDVAALCSRYPSTDTGLLPRSEQGDHCTKNEDCTNGFVCVVDNGDQYCAARCGADGECVSGTTCEDPGSGSPVCILERVTTCGVVHPTRAGLVALGLVLLAIRRRTLR